MDTQDFIARYPKLLHLADARSWPSIERHGLLSAAEIVRRWRGLGPDAEQLLAKRRPESVRLEHPDLGLAVLRDQHPLNERLLASALTDGMTVEGWLRRLNDMVFFFTSEVRLQALHAAYRHVPAVLLTVRTRTLVQEHEDRIRLAGMNTGYTGRKVKERGADTFLPIRRYNLKAKVQEVVVLHDVPDLENHLISAEPLSAPDCPRVAGTTDAAL